MTAHLSVNVNAIAQLRNRRNLPWPSVEGLSRIALDAGGAGITVHPRPDERHIRRADVPVLKALIAGYARPVEFNIEGYPDEAFLQLVEANRPHQVTLVPDEPGQATSDHGWDVAANYALLRRVIARIKAGGMRVSLFVDADPAAMPMAKAVGADRVELYTGPYGGSHADKGRETAELARIEAAGKAAHLADLGLNAGHDLTVENLPALARALPHLAEVSIGHALTADALIHGMEGAVKRFLAACEGRAP